MNTARAILNSIINTNWDVTVTNENGGTIITVRAGNNTAHLQLGSKKS